MKRVSWSLVISFLGAATSKRMVEKDHELDVVASTVQEFGEHTCEDFGGISLGGSKVVCECPYQSEFNSIVSEKMTDEERFTGVRKHLCWDWSYGKRRFLAWKSDPAKCKCQNQMYKPQCAAVRVPLVAYDPDKPETHDPEVNVVKCSLPWGQRIKAKVESEEGLRPIDATWLANATNIGTLVAMRARCKGDEGYPDCVKDYNKTGVILYPSDETTRWDAVYDRVLEQFTYQLTTELNEKKAELRSTKAALMMGGRGGGFGGGVGGGFGGPSQQMVNELERAVKKLEDEMEKFNAEAVKVMDPSAAVNSTDPWDVATNDDEYDENGDPCEGTKWYKSVVCSWHRMKGWLDFS